MIKKQNHVLFLSIDTLKLYYVMSFDFLIDHVKIITSRNQGVLLCHAYNGLQYYMWSHATKQ